jgi:hypothetical protein
MSCSSLILIYLLVSLIDNFPEYEILYSESSNISSQDYIYVFSILLYYSCVTVENKFFQQCCQELIHEYQMGVFSFFEYFSNHKNFSKESIRTAIKQSISMMSPPKSPKKMFTLTSSPLDTPTKYDCQSTPTTPNKEFFNQKLKELKIVRTQLDTEKFEKSMLEVEMRQNQEKIEHLGESLKLLQLTIAHKLSITVVKCQSLSHEAQKLRDQMLFEIQDENRSPNKNHLENHIRNKMQKEIQRRDDLIANLKYENDSICTTNKKYRDKVTTMEKQMKDMYNKILDLDASLNELRYNVDRKNEKIQMLEKENKEYQDTLSHINDTRSTCKDLSLSDMMEFSCSTHHTMYLTVNNSDTESLGKSVVVDVKLKEKEIEINELKEELLMAAAEKKSLEQRVSSLIKTIKTLEVRLNDGASGSLNEENSTEANHLQVPILSRTYERDKTTDDTVITTSDIGEDDDDDADWIEDEEETCSRKHSNPSVRDKSWQREQYHQRQKQMRNNRFNNTRRRSSSQFGAEITSQQTG